MIAPQQNEIKQDFITRGLEDKSLILKFNKKPERIAFLKILWMHHEKKMMIDNEKIVKK